MSQRSRSVLVGILAAVAILIPTYIAIANYAILGSWQNTLVSEDTALVIRDKKDSTVFEGKAGEENTLNLAKALAQMLKDGKALRNLPAIEDADVYTVTADIADKSRNYLPITNLATASEEATYSVNKNLSLSFSTLPDAATVEITNGTETVYYGDYEDFSGMSFEGSVQLTVVIEAKWNQSEDRDYYGEAKYQFFVNYSAKPAFSISATKATIGDYIAISILNASSHEDITFTSSPDLGITPTFYEDGDYVRALIPFRSDLPGGVYSIHVQTKGAEETYEVTLEERSTLSRPYDAGTELINRAHSAEDLSDYDRLRREIAAAPSPTKYFNGKFIDYRDSSSIGAILMLGYGHTRTLVSGESYRMDGVDFIIYQGTDVPALNSGMVIATGQTDYLGNYVIVDHGLGLRSWYCHLSEISVSVGDTVTNAQAVGKSGNTGFTTGSGVYLICTIGETPISPYTLWSDGVVYQ